MPLKSFRIWLRNTRMHFSSEQRCIMQRMLREEGGWQSHLDNTRGYILSAVKKYHPKTVRILGSGWLLDIPVRELTEMCEKVVQVDITHPSQVVHKYSENPRITFETLDLTGGVADYLYKLKRSNFNIFEVLSYINGIKPLSFSEDLIVSANLLSQLNIYLTDYLIDKGVKLHGAQVEELAKAIQTKHLQSLPKGRSVLITDYEEEYHNEAGGLIGSRPTLFIELPENPSAEWDWQFDTKMTYRDDCKTVLKVVALAL